MSEETIAALAQLASAVVSDVFSNLFSSSDSDAD